MRILALYIMVLAGIPAFAASAAALSAKSTAAEIEIDAPSESSLRSHAYDAVMAILGAGVAQGSVKKLIVSDEAYPRPFRMLKKLCVEVSTRDPAGIEGRVVDKLRVIDTASGETSISMKMIASCPN